MNTALPSDAPSPRRAADTTTALLAARARGGDREAYDRLFALSAERARLFARMRLGPSMRARFDVEDILQEAWLEAHRSFASFEPRGAGSFARWLCGVIENRIRSLSDRETAQKRHPGTAFERISHVADRVAASRSGAAGVAAAAEERDRLVAAMDGLDDEVRAVVLHRFFEDLTIDEIAARTGRSASTVRRLLGRGLRDLARALGRPA